MIELARRKLPGARFDVSPIERYRSDRPFEVIYFCGALHHMPDPKLVAARLAGLAAPGAQLVICEPNARWLFSPLWLNRAARAANPVWWWLRWRNRAAIAAVARGSDGLGEPAFHQPPDAARIRAWLAPHFELLAAHSDFAWTRLFEGVIFEPGRIPDALRRLDRLTEAWTPGRGGSLEMVFRKL